jgi:hypothetical protein
LGNSTIDGCVESYGRHGMTHDDVAVPGPQGWLNVSDAIFHNARRRPSHPAIIDGARTITYAELAGLIAKTSGHLENVGARAGDIVGVALGSLD